MQNDIQTENDNSSQHLQAPNSKTSSDPRIGPLLSLSIPRLDVPKSIYVKLNDSNEGDPVLVLPSMEGLFNVVEPLAKLLTRPAFGLNWTQDFNSVNSVEEAARLYLKNCEEIVKNNTFDLIGYSFGSVLAYEMALQIQKSGKQVKNLILLDGSPSQTSNGIRAYCKIMGAQDERAKLNTGIMSFLVQHIPVDTTATMQELAKLTDREAKLDYVTKLFESKAKAKLEASGTSSNDIRMAASAYASKMFMMHHYKPSAKFNGNCLLIRAEETLIKDASIDYDYNMKDSITGQCQVHCAKGDHVTFIKNELEFIARLIELKLSPA